MPRANFKDSRYTFGYHFPFTLRFLKWSRNNVTELVIAICDGYRRRIREELDERADMLAIYSEWKEVSPVLLALLGRQTSLAGQLASAPQLWNEHVAPMYLRGMIDVYVTLAWISRDPAARAKQYRDQGVVQIRDFLAHWKLQLDSDGITYEEDPIISSLSEWLTEFGGETPNATGDNYKPLTIKQMAEEADCADLYNYTYAMFSSSVHSMWGHVSRFNLTKAEEGDSRHATDPDSASDPAYLVIGAKYLDKVARLFDELFLERTPQLTAFGWMKDKLDRCFKRRRRKLIRHRREKILCKKVQRLFCSVGIQPNVACRSPRRKTSVIIYPTRGSGLSTKKNAVYEISAEELKDHADPFRNDFQPREAPHFKSLKSAFFSARHDVFVLGFHGGEGEDGTVQKEFEKLKIAFTGSGSLASEKAFDKRWAKKIAGDHGIRTAAQIEINGSDLPDAEKLLSDFFDEVRRHYRKARGRGIQYWSFQTHRNVAYSRRPKGLGRRSVHPFLVRNVYWGHRSYGRYL